MSGLNQDRHVLLPNMCFFQHDMNFVLPEGLLRLLIGRLQFCFQLSVDPNFSKPVSLPLYRGDHLQREEEGGQVLCGQSLSTACVCGGGGGECL